MTHHLYAYNGCNNLLQKNYQTIWPSNAVRGVNIMPWQMQKGQEGNIGLQFWNRREWTIPAEGHPQAGWQAHHENNESNSEDILKKLLKAQQIFIEPNCQPQIPTQTLKIWTILKLMHLHMTTSDKTKTDTPPI
jgi:hypothetical protein